MRPLHLFWAGFLVACSSSNATSTPTSSGGAGGAGGAMSSPPSPTSSGTTGVGGFAPGSPEPLPTPWETVDFPHPVGVWVKQSPTEGKPSPDLLYEGGATWDPYAKRLIHHAGHDRIAQGHHVFEFDLLHQGWQQIFPDDSPPGACLVDGAMTFDLVHRRATRWSGLSLNHGSQFSREVKLKRSWIWLYDAAKMEWANMRPPPYETAGDTGFPVGAVTNSQAVTFDRRRAVVLSHGGISAPGGRVVSYDAYDNSIEIAASNDNAPSERDDHAFAADPVHDRYYVWGSQYASDPALYIYHPQDGTWEKRTLANTPPYDRSMPRMACDGVTHRCLVVGRDSATGRMFTSLLDTKDYTWTSITTPMPPDALKSRGLNLSYAPDLNVYVLELQTSTDREEVWTFRVEEAPVPQGPAAPSTLKVTTSATSAHLEWDASPAAQSYRIYRGTGTNSRTVKLALLDEVTGVAFDDDAVPTDGIAYYEVRAVADGQESAYGPRARARPPVPKMPVVTVVDAHHVRLGLAAGGGADVVGFNVYRGVAEVATTMGGEPIVSAYGYNNDAPYDSARVVSVKNITGLARLNEAVVAADSFEDATVDLATPLPASGGSPTAVYAYVVRAVNRLGVESGPSPYQLTIPSAPRSVMIDDRTSDAVLRWEPPREGAVRYRIYAIPTNGQVVEVTPGTLTTTSATLPGVDGARYTVTAIDVLGQEGQPSSPVWFKRSYPGFFTPPWHQ